LKSFTSESPEWSLADLSETVGINKTTVYRMLTALEAEGLVQRTPNRDGYALGPALIMLGAVALETNDLRTVSEPELRALAEETGETAALEIPVGGEVLILAEAIGPGMVKMQAEVGTRWPMHATSTGKALLAAVAESLGESAFEELGLPDSLPELTPRTLTTRDQLKDDLARIQKRGYATAFEEMQAGYAAVSAVVRDQKGEAVAAIGIGGPTSRVTEERFPELGELVRARAIRVSRKLGAAV